MEDNNNTPTSVVSKVGKKLALQHWTVRVEADDVQRVKALQVKLETSVAGVLTTLLDRFEKPLQVEDTTDELRLQVATLQQQLAALQQEQETWQQQQQELETLRGQHQAAVEERNRYAEQLNAATLREEQAAQRLAEWEPGENEVRLVLLPANLKVLDYVASRESKRRGQAWSRSHVVNHFIHSRFVAGELNGDLRSVPDGDLRKMGIEPAPAPADAGESAGEGEEVTL